MLLSHIILVALQIISAHSARDRGVFRLNCATAGGACQNACFYMYCANPQPQGHVFVDGGNDPGNVLRDRNRRQAGTDPTGGPPCRVLPFSQKFFDVYPFWSSVMAGDSLETDEFPLAAWQQNNFVANAWPPRNTLRCIPGRQNGNAGGQYRDFRRGQGPWGNINPDQRVIERLGPSAVFSQGDWFQVAFMNVDDDLMPACRQVPDCSNTNPAQQFHMTNKRNSDGSTALNPPGIIRWPYDPTAENTYEITDVQAQHADRPLRMLKMTIRRGRNNYAVRIYAYSRTTDWVQVSLDNNGGSGAYAEQSDGPFTIPANPSGPNLGLREPVTIAPDDDPDDSCGRLIINYGNPGTADPHAYGFHTGATGYSDQMFRVNIGTPANPLYGGQYCRGSAPRDAQGRVEQGVYSWDCYFPAS